MKVKEFIRLLKNFDENLMVTFADDYGMGALAFTKEHSSILRGRLESVETPLGDYVRFKHDEKGSYLMVSLEASEIFKPEDVK
jgi:hypothetical protein